jgi:transcription elongation GreA/GreB family factor
MDLKKQLYQQCLDDVNERLETINKTILSNQTALHSETKSSAGDKHETGRAMLQLEMEKAGQQLKSVQQMKDILARIDPEKRSELAILGSLVETSLGTYFLSVSVGQIVLENQSYFAISTSSPIGKLLIGKEQGAILAWNGKEFQVNKIS